MNMSHQWAGLAQRRGGIGLFNVHVKQIGQDSDIPCAQAAQPCRGIAKPVAKIGFVTIKWLEEQRHSISPCVCSQILECLGEVDKRLVARNSTLPSPLHRADDRGRTQRSRGVDNASDKFPRSMSHRGIGMRERQFVHDPSGTSPNRRDPQLMPLEQTGQL